MLELYALLQHSSTLPLPWYHHHQSFDFETTITPLLGGVSLISYLVYLD